MPGRHVETGWYHVESCPFVPAGFMFAEARGFLFVRLNMRGKNIPAWWELFLILLI